MTTQTPRPSPAPAPGQAPEDPRRLLRAAIEQAVTLVSGLTPEQLPQPTPCARFDVRALAGHIVAILRRVEHVARGGRPLDIPQVITGIGDDQWAATARADQRRLQDAWADDAILDRVLRLPFGNHPGRAAALAYSQESTVHAWDLAVATGRADHLDPELAAVALPLAQQFVPARPRGGRVPFGPVVDLATGASPYAQVAAWLGRDPRPWGSL